MMQAKMDKYCRSNNEMDSNQYRSQSSNQNSSYQNKLLCSFIAKFVKFVLLLLYVIFNFFSKIAHTRTTA